MVRHGYTNMNQWQLFNQYEQSQRETRRVAFQKLQEKKSIKTKGNPIEDRFLEAFQNAYPSVELLPQYRIGKYRVDFACVEAHFVIEIDGQEYHHKPMDRTKDYQRQHALEDLGWHFLRFTGAMIFHDVEGCVERAYKRIQRGW